MEIDSEHLYSLILPYKSIPVVKRLYYQHMLLHRE